MCGPDNVEAYLLRTAVNRGRDAWRREKLWGAADGDEGLEALSDTAPIQDEVIIARARLTRVRAGIEHMPPRTLPSRLPQ